MPRLTVDIPDDAAAALTVTAASETAMRRELLFLAALKLYELGRLSSGAAARLADMPRTLFLARLGDYGVDAFRLTPEDVQGEATLAQGHL